MKFRDIKKLTLICLLSVVLIALVSECPAMGTPEWLTSTRFAGGDDCVSATTISSSNYADSGDTTGANNTVGNYSLATMPSTYPGPDKFYKLVLTSTTNVSASMSLTGSALDGVIYLTKTCPAGTGNTILAANTVAASQDSIGAGVGPEIMPLTQLTAGTYYIGVDSFAASGTGSAGTYTLTVTSLAPSAAMVSISGRVTTAFGQGIKNAEIQLIAPDGNIRTFKTSSFGYYRFDDVESGSSYTLSVRSKQHSFAVPTRVVSVSDDIADMDFTAQP